MFDAHDPGLALFVAQRAPDAEPPLVATLCVLAAAITLLTLLMTGAIG